MATSNASNTQITVSSAGAVNYPKQPCFLASMSTTTANVSGNGTVVTLVFNSEKFDQGANYNPATGVFSASVTGKYFFQVGIGFANFNLTTHTRALIKAVATSRTFTLMDFSPVGLVKMATTWDAAFSCDMTAGDQLYITYMVDGGLQTAGYLGDTGGQIRTYFSGKLEV